MNSYYDRLVRREELRRWVRDEIASRIMSRDGEEVSEIDPTASEVVMESGEIIDARTTQNLANAGMTSVLPDGSYRTFATDPYFMTEQEYEDFTASEEEWLSRSEQAAELAAERYFEEGPHGGYYAGSEEEARDRWLDSLNDRAEAAWEDRTHRSNI